MANEIPDIERYVKDNALVIPLEPAYERAGAFLEAEFDYPKYGPLEIPQGLSRTILDEIQRILPRIDATVDLSRKRVQQLVGHPRIRNLDGQWVHKVVVTAGIMTDVAEEVADVLWMHRHGEEIKESLASARAIGEEDEDRINEEWKRIYRQAGRVFGIIE